MEGLCTNNENKKFILYDLQLYHCSKGTQILSLKYTPKFMKGDSSGKKKFLFKFPMVINF